MDKDAVGITERSQKDLNGKYKSSCDFFFW